MSIREMEMLGIGSPNDVGGTETEGTVMAKENAILAALNAYGAKVKNNMVIKETDLRSFQIAASGVTVASFSFEKPVKILGIYFSRNFTASVYQVPVYIINGENSYMARSILYPDALHPPCLTMALGKNTAIWFTNDSKYEIINGIWATKLDIHMGGNDDYIGKTVSIKIIYQEEE